MSRTTSEALPSTSLAGEPAAAINEIGDGWQLLRYADAFGPPEADHPPVAAEDNSHGGFALMAEKQVIARVTAVPTRARIDAFEHDAAWLADLWVDPAYRDGPAAHLLVRECVKALDTTFISTSDPEALRVYRDYGQREFGCLSSFLRVLRPQRFAAALPRLPREAAQERWLALLRRGASWPGGHWVASGTMRLRARIQTAGRTDTEGVRYHPAGEHPEPEQLDRLWERCCESLRAAPVRDATYWAARRHSGDGMVSVEDAQGLAGVAVLRLDDADQEARFPGLRIARVVDFLYALDRRETAMRFFAGLEAVAHQENADALMLTASHGGLPWLLRRRGYVSLPESRRFLARSQQFALGRLRLSDWWLTGADGEVGSSVAVAASSDAVTSAAE